VSKHIVVTGAAGMVGSHVAEQLLARGDRVVGVDDLSTGDLANLAGVLGSASALLAVAAPARAAASARRPGPVALMAWASSILFSAASTAV
jgi:nucleoside-diphosphate-sugar epimerase